MPQKRPGKAWNEMVRGNRRFVEGTPNHPRQDVERRESLATVQNPDVVLFGCADSRLAAEIIFDKGLGDLFVVRNAGQVMSDDVVGSIEYAVGVLDVPLIVVLGHDSCGAVAASISSRADGADPLPEHIQGIVDQIAPAVDEVAAKQGVAPSDADAAAVGLVHLRHTVAALLEKSAMVSEAVAAGTLGIVGANYKLREGLVVPDMVVGIRHFSDDA